MNDGTYPAVPDVEEAVLGALLLDPDCFEAAGPIHVACFDDPGRRLIFDAFRTLRARGSAADVVAVAVELRQRGHLEQIGGAAYLHHLTAQVSTTANVRSHLRILDDYDRRRKLIKVSRYVEYVCSNGGLDPGRIHRVEGTFRSLMVPARKPSTPETPAFARASVNVVDLLLDQSVAPDSIIGNGLLRPRQFGMIYGAAGIGKTWVLLELLLASSLGHDWYGIPCAPAVVGMASLELESWDLRDRLKEIITARSLAVDDLEARIWFVSPPDFDATLDITSPEGYEALECWIKTHHIQLAVIDTLSRAHHGEEKDLRPVANAAFALARATDSAILFCHHVRKPAPGGKTGGTMYESRGDSRFLGDAKFVAGIEEREGLLRLTIEKANTGRKLDPVWLSRSPNGVLSKTEGPNDRALESKERKTEFTRLLQEAGSKGLTSGELAKTLNVSTRTIQLYAAETQTITVGKGRSTRIRIANHETTNRELRDSL